MKNLANVPNLNVSSDKASTKADHDQSDPEVIKSVNISDESRTSTSTSLAQGYPIYESPASSPSPPTTVESSPTTDPLLDMSYNAAPLIPLAPLMPTLSKRRPSVIRCPAATCDEQFIAINLSPVNDVFLEPDDVIDQVFQDNNYPAVNRETHPILFNTSLHEYGRDVEHAWSKSRQEGDWMEDSEEDTEEDTQ